MSIILLASLMFGGSLLVTFDTNSPSCFRKGDAVEVKNIEPMRGDRVIISWGDGTIGAPGTHVFRSTPGSLKICGANRISSEWIRDFYDDHRQPSVLSCSFIGKWDEIGENSINNTGVRDIVISRYVKRINYQNGFGSTSLRSVSVESNNLHYASIGGKVLVNSATPDTAADRSLDVIIATNDADLSNPKYGSLFGKKTTRLYTAPGSDCLAHIDFLPDTMGNAAICLKTGVTTTASSSSSANTLITAIRAHADYPILKGTVLRYSYKNGSSTVSTKVTL